MTPEQYEIVKARLGKVTAAGRCIRITDLFLMANKQYEEGKDEERSERVAYFEEKYGASYKNLPMQFKPDAIIRALLDGSATEEQMIVAGVQLVLGNTLGLSPDANFTMLMMLFHDVIQGDRPHDHAEDPTQKPKLH